MDERIFTPTVCRELEGLPEIEGGAEDQLIPVTHRAIARMSTLPLGTVGGVLAREGVKAYFPGSNVYQVKSIRDFCLRHTKRTAERLSTAEATRPDRLFGNA